VRRIFVSSIALKKSATMNKQEIFTAAHKEAKAGAIWRKYATRFREALKSQYEAAKAAKTFLSVEEIVSRIKAIDPAFQPRNEGGYIVGYYRAKSSQFYKFDISNRRCVVDNAGFSSIINKIFA
jgi:hypothetical protein